MLILLSAPLDDGLVIASLWEYLCVVYTRVLDGREGILVAVTILV